MSHYRHQKKAPSVPTNTDVQSILDDILKGA